MGDRRASDERLPWLDAAPAPASATPAAATRARTPLLLLLAMLVGGTMAVMAFLAGRISAPGEREPRAAAPTEVRLPAATPTPVVTVPPPVVTPPEPRAIAPATARPATARGTPVAAKPRARRPSRPDRRGMVPRIERAFPLAPIASAEPRALPAAPPAKPRARAAPRSGVVQLGAYVSMPLLDAAWARLVAAYPYLGTMPRVVSGTALPGRPYYYRLRVIAGSRREARALCDHLHRIGRGCMVVGAK